MNHKKVQRIMGKLGLKAKKFTRKSRCYSSYEGNVGTIAKNLIHRRFYTNTAYQKLTTDITEFKYSDGLKLYLSPVMDMYNGEILSYGIHMRPTLDFVMKPLEDALKVVKDAKYRTTIHSDQSWHYQHNKWVNSLKKNQIFQKACPVRETVLIIRQWRASSAS